MLVAEALAEFLMEHKARGSSRKTILYYRQTVSNVLRDYLEQPLDCLTVFTVNKALQNMADRGIKSATLASADRALRGFCNWLVGVELLAKNPMQGRKRPKIRQEPKQILTAEEIKKLFAVAKADKRYRDRNVAILFLLLACGLRAGEVANLKLTDIDWSQGILTVNGKTGYGTVPASSQVLKAIKHYVTHCRRSKSQYLFVYDGREITAETVSRLIARIGKRANIGRPIGPHILRHTFATAFIENGGDAFSLKRILRHTTMYTSLMYVHQSTASIRQKMESTTLFRDIHI